MNDISKTVAIKVGDKLQKQNPFFMHPSHVACETLGSIAALFFSYISPLCTISESSLKHCVRYALKCKLVDSAADLIWTLLAFFSTAKRIYVPLSRNNKTVAFVEDLVGQIMQSFVPWWKINAAMILLSQLRNGNALNRQAANRTLVLRKIDRNVFPSDRYDNIVVASNADNLVLSIIRSQTSVDKTPVLMVPGVIFFPHSSAIFFVRGQGVIVVGYEINLDAYEVNLPDLTTGIKKQLADDKEVFVLLPSIQGRRITNSNSAFSVIRDLKATSIELTVPTMEMPQSNLDNTSSSFSSGLNHQPDATIVSFASISGLNCGIGSFKRSECGAKCQQFLDSSKEPRLVSLWLKLIQQTIRYFLSNRVSFGLAVHAVSLLSQVTENMQRETKLTEAEQLERSICAVRRFPYTLGTASQKRGSRGTEKVHPSQLANLLLCFSKYFKAERMNYEFIVLWKFLAEFPPYINIVSIGSCVDPLISTEINFSGLIISAVNEVSVVQSIRSAGFEGVCLTSLDGEGQRQPRYLRDKVVVFNNTEVGSNKIIKFIFIPFHSSVSKAQQKLLLHAIGEIPEDHFGRKMNRAYSSEEVRFILHRLQLSALSRN